MTTKRKPSPFYGTPITHAFRRWATRHRSPSAGDQPATVLDALFFFVLIIIAVGVMLSTR